MASCLATDATGSGLNKNRWAAPITCGVPQRRDERRAMFTGMAARGPRARSAAPPRSSHGSRPARRQGRNLSNHLRTRNAQIAEADYYRNDSECAESDDGNPKKSMFLRRIESTNRAKSVLIDLFVPVRTKQRVLAPLQDAGDAAGCRLSPPRGQHPNVQCVVRTARQVFLY